MKRDLVVIAAAVAIAAEAMVVVPSISVAQTPPMGGGYTNVIPIRSTRLWCMDTLTPSREVIVLEAR